MTYAGRLRFRVQAYRRAGETSADLGTWTAGGSRRAEIESKAASDEEIAAGLVGLDRVAIHVRADPVTRTWGTADRIKEIFGPGGMGRIFELTAPAQFDVSGRWLTFEGVAGHVDLDGEDSQ